MTATPQQAPPPVDPFLTPAEIAKALRVGKMTIYRLLNQGVIQSTRVGHQFRVRRSAVDRYLRTGIDRGAC